MSVPDPTQAAAAEKVCAVVVTFNRLKLLQEVLASLALQTRPPDQILVVNNASTDGTTQWLAQQPGLKVINQDNCGGAGGFSTGVQAAFEQGFDWIWCMDDDVVAEKECLQTLLAFGFQLGQPAILCPLRFTPAGQPLGNEQVLLNYENPFRDHGPVRLRALLAGGNGGTGHSKVEGFTFEGPLIHSRVISAVGLPDKDLFILGDDTDFSLKCVHKFECHVIHDAIMHRRIAEEEPSGITWKDYYYIRNTITLLDRRYGSFAVKWLRPLIRSLRFLSNRYVHHRCKHRTRGTLLVIKGLVHGYLGILGRQH
jgi:GT2 family glycosyltransferase